MLADKIRLADQIESYRRYWLIVACIELSVIVILTLVPGSSRPDTGTGGWFEHLAAYTLVGAAFGLALPMIRQMIISGIALTGIAAILESLQHFSPGRNPEIEGFLMSSIGAWIGLGLSPLILMILNANRTAR